MKKKYIKPVILCCYDIETSIMTASQVDASTDKPDGSGAQPGTPDVGGSDGVVPGTTKGTSWDLWEDEEENSFY